MWFCHKNYISTQSAWFLSSHWNFEVQTWGLVDKILDQAFVQVPNMIRGGEAQEHWSHPLHSTQTMKMKMQPSMVSANILANPKIQDAK